MTAPKPKARIKRVTAEEIVLTSKMKTWFGYQGERLMTAVITMSGEASKIPSTANEKLITIDRNQRERMKSLARGAHMPHFKSQLMDAIEKLRPTTRTNPDVQAKLQAMTQLYQRTLLKKRGPNHIVALTDPSFKDTKKDRLLMLLLLGESCSRMDSHNLSKAACDWLQTIGLVVNDGHLDCFPLPKNWLRQADPRTTTMVVIRAEDSSDAINTFTSSIMAAAASWLKAPGEEVRKE